MLGEYPQNEESSTLLADVQLPIFGGALVVLVGRQTLCWFANATLAIMPYTLAIMPYHQIYIHKLINN